MESRIVIVGLDNFTTKNISIAVTDKLDMFFLDVNDLIKYSFSDEADTVAKVGISYYQKQIKKLVLSTCDYENTIINCPYDLLLNEDISSQLKQKTTIIFIDINKDYLQSLNQSKPANNKLDVQILAYEELTNLLANLADIKVNYDGNNMNDLVDNIAQLVDNAHEN